MTIGQVVDLLKDEYPDISISKVRYLESEGLLRPIRTKGGYRTFSENDVDRLKTILSLQSEHYLPLQVIKKRLKSGTASIKTSPKMYSSISAENDYSEFSFAELSKKTGISIAKLEEMQKYGLIKEALVNGEETFTSTDFNIASLAKKLEKFGIGARHLRMHVSAAERQSSIYKQIFGPKLNKSSNKTKTSQSINELRQIIEELEASLLDREINELLN